MTDNFNARGGKKDNLDEFEELSESREIIEDRIFRLKLQMIDLTITQQELSSQSETLEADSKLLEQQMLDAQAAEANAAEKEEYEEAEKLNLKIQSIKALLTTKRANIKKLEEDTTGLENRKGDKQVELSQLIVRSQKRLNELKTCQQNEMKQYEETEQLAVDEKKKRLHYERIRIQEDRTEIQQQKEECQKME